MTLDTKKTNVHGKPQKGNMRLSYTKDGELVSVDELGTVVPVGGGGELPFARDMAEHTEIVFLEEAGAPISTANVDLTPYTPPEGTTFALVSYRVNEMDGLSSFVVFGSSTSRIKQTAKAESVDGTALIPINEDGTISYSVGGTGTVTLQIWIVGFI